MMFSIINNTFASYLFDLKEIYTAKLQYSNKDWDNKDIHDTHFTSTDSIILFNEQILGRLTPKTTMKDYKQILLLINENIKYISKLAACEIYNYSNTKNSYEVYGIDVLIRDDMTPFIMEVNGKLTGYEATEYLMKDYFKWIKDCIVLPTLFPGTDIPPQRMETTPIYTQKILYY